MGNRDGGPAFPVKGGMCFFVPDDVAKDVKVEVQQSITQEFQGMTMRDYFAASALTGMCGCQDFLNEISKATGSKEEAMSHVARWAFKYADAMLVEKNKERPFLEGH